MAWILRTDAPWRDLPPELGGCKNSHRRFCRWRDKGAWERLLELLMNDPDHERLMTGATFVKLHQHGSGAVGGTQGAGRTKGDPTRRCIWPWMRIACRSESIVTGGPVADCTQAGKLV